MIDRLTDRSKIDSYCKFLDDAGMCADTTKRRLLIVRHTLQWYRTIKLVHTDDNFVHVYTRCEQTEAYLGNLIKAYQRSYDVSSARDRCIGPLVRSGRWPDDSEVRDLSPPPSPTYPHPTTTTTTTATTHFLSLPSG